LKFNFVANAIELLSGFIVQYKHSWCSRNKHWNRFVFR